MKIVELHIYLNLNLEQTEATPILFTYSMIHHGKDNKPSSKRKNNHPFFSPDIRYLNYQNQIQGFSFEEKVDLFFNKERFIQVFNSQNTQPQPQAQPQAQPQPQNTQTTTPTLPQENISVMLFWLFPITFPYKTTISTSSELLFSSTPKIELPSLFSLLSTIDNSKKFSYLNYNNKTLTIMRILILNDVINHPKYRELFETIKNYYISAHKYNEKGTTNNTTKIVKELIILSKNIPDIRTNLVDLQQKIQDNINNRNIDIIELQQTIQTINSFITTLESNTHYSDSTNSNSAHSLNLIVEQLYNFEPVMENIDNKKYFSSILKHFNRVYEISKKIRTDNRNKNIYKNGVIDIDENKDFEPYRKTVEIIKNFIYPKFVSNNDPLQLLIENYANNLELNQDVKMIPFVNSLFMKLNDGEMNKFLQEQQLKEQTQQPITISNANFEKYSQTYTSVVSSSETYEVYLLMDVLQDEINDNNKDKVTCLLKDEILGNKLEEYIYGKNSYDLMGNRLSSTIAVEKEKINGGRKRKNNKTKKQKEFVKKTQKRRHKHKPHKK